MHSKSESEELYKGEFKLEAEWSEDIVIGPVPDNISKYQRSLILHEGGNPAFLGSLPEREFLVCQAMPGLFGVGTNSLTSHQAAERSSLKLVPSLG